MRSLERDLGESVKPLVTFALLAYNQQEYIRDAIEGAFSQTYSPLQIILSDDCSYDNTFEIMQKMAEEYVGPHKLLLNRNKVNSGLANHINHVMALANGELVIGAAGDDISLPERTDALVSVWLANSKKAMSIHSAYLEMDALGNVGDVKQCLHKDNLNNLTACIEKNLHVIGATHAWSKEVFRIFGPLRIDLIHEDRAIPFRALLIGGIEYLEVPLVKYRIGVGISSNYGGVDIQDELYGRGAVVLARYYVDYLQKYQDLKIIKADSALLKICNKRLQEQKFAKSLSRKEPRTAKLFFSAVRDGAGVWFSTRQLLKYVSPDLTVQLRKIISALRSVLRVLKNFEN